MGNAMEVEIYSREAIEELLQGEFPKNTAVISFYDPPTNRTSEVCNLVDYKDKPESVFYVSVHDIDIEILADYGLTFDTYFSEATELAKYIYNAKEQGFDIICQCEYGQSRSAACASAIVEHFYKSGITIFADYRYYPNQLIFNKLLTALNDMRK